MEYESDRALIETKLEEAKRKACSDFDSYFDLKGEVHDPNWAQPTYQSCIQTVPVNEAQGFWINGGKTGGKKDEPCEKSETFDHDLETLPKDGPKELPDVPKDTLSNLLVADIEALMNEYNTKSFNDNGEVKLTNLSIARS